MQSLPNDTTYTWIVTNHITGIVFDNTTGMNLEQYSRVFSTAGTYKVVVLGVYIRGSFTTSLTITIRS